MTTTDVISSAAITLSFTAALACLFSMPLLFQKGSSMKYDLGQGMEEFRAMTEDTWLRMMAARKGSNIPFRQKRQEAPHCHCYDRKCHEAKC